MSTPIRAISAGSFAGLLLLALLFAPAPSPVDAVTNCTGGNPAIDSEEQALLGLINAHRAQHGLGSLSLNPVLNRAAAWMANDLASNRYFAHVDSLGRAPYRRAVDCGYPAGAGENLAAGVTMDTAQKAFDAWKASAGHNANMLSPHFREIGIARHFDAASPYKWYWATNFGTMQGGGSTPSPTPTPTRTPTPAPTPTPTRTPTPTATVPLPSATPSAPAGPPRTATPAPTLTPPPATSTPPASLPLYPGANLVTWVGSSGPAETALGPYRASVSVVYSWDTATRSWKRFGPGLPSYVNTLHRLEGGRAYWVIATSPATLTLER